MTLDTDRNRVTEIRLAAHSVIASIRAALDQANYFSNAYAITSRVKSKDRFLSKISDRRAKGNALYNADSVTDAVGVRIITHHRDEIPDVLRRLFLLLRPSRTAASGYMANGTVKELIEYVPHTPAENDPFTGELRAIFNAAYQGSPPFYFEPKAKGGYSSIHMVARFPSDELDAGEVGVEIQIRSVFEDAWGQIDHKLSYEQERRVGSVDPAQREQLKRHLTLLKRYLDAAADHADLIKATFVAPSVQKTVNKNLGSQSYLPTLFESAKITQALQDRISSLLSRKVAVDSETEGVAQQDAGAAYVQIADDLSNTINSELDPTQTDISVSAVRARAVIRTSMLLESALCRFLSEDRQQLRLAVAQYKAIAEDEPENPICWFRQGQALASLAFEAVPGSQEALEFLAEAQHAYRQTEAALMRIAEGTSPVNLNVYHEGVEFIRANLVKLHAFAVWRVIDLKAGVSELTDSDVVSVCEAYALSKAGIVNASTAESEIRLVNNALYFGTYARDRASSINAKAADLPDLSEMNELFDRLLSYCKDGQVVLMSHWDTLVAASILLNRAEEGMLAAKKVMDANTDPSSLKSDFGSSYAVEMRRRAVEVAWPVYRDSTQGG